MDYLFDIDAIDQGCAGVDCARCPIFSIGAPKYDKAHLVHDANSDRNLLIVGSRVSKFAHLNKVPVVRDALEPILKLLPDVYNVWYIPAASCYTEESVTHDGMLVCAKCCSANVIAAIKDTKAEYVLPFDSPAIAAIYHRRSTAGSNAGLWRGNRIPDQTLKCFVVPLLRFIRPSAKGDNAHWYSIQEDLKLVDPHAKLPTYTVDIDYSDSILHTLRDGDVIAIDYETSGLKPDNDGHFIYSVSIYKLGDTISYSFLLTEGNIELLKAVLSNGKISKIGHNIKMEERWSRSILNTPVKGWVWDTCIGAHCINSTQGNSGLKFQAFVNFGREDYSTRVSQYIEAEQSNSLNRIRESPVELLLEYGAWDAYYTGLLYGIQRKTLESRTNNIGKPFTYGVEFFTLVQRAFAVMESTGIGFDVAMMESNEAGIKSKQQELETQFKQTGLFQTWQDAYGSKLNIYSSNQLGGVLFDKLKLDPPKLTEKGKWAVDEDALAEIEHPDLENFIRIKKYEKILGTYYSQFRREVSQHGILHCEMQLNTTRTYRTSCTKPNLQNISRTDKEQAQYIRGLFKSQFPDYVIVEADLKGCEVSGAACHTLDKNLITYVSDSNRDMHRDLAEVLYGIPNDQVSKELRSITKVYTFGSFYGSFWKLTGPHLWKLIHMHQPKLVDGTPVVDYLYDKGFTSVERYTEHVKSADEFMWYKQFPEYRKWKDWVYDEYLKTGYVDMFTGFRRYGPLNRNMVINTPIQGDSGHINLWLCCYVLSRINREKIPAKLFLQIHDSVVGLVHKEALDVYCQLYRDGIEALKKQWTWMITPFEIEYEVAPVGGSWYDKMEYKLK